MKKATKKTESPKETATTPNLGTKRVCPECSTRFYDFGRPEIICPKCETKVSAEELDPVAKLQLAKKNVGKAVADEPSAAMRPEEGEEPAAGGIMDDMDDLSDDGDEIVEDLVNDDEENEF